MKTTLFKKDLPTLTKEMDQGNLNGHTFVRRDGIVKSFEGIKIRGFNNWIDATVYLKELLSDYADQYPELFEDTNRYDVDSIKLFTMINKWATDNTIIYAGWRGSDGNHNQAGNGLFAWLPVRVVGEFAYVCCDLYSKRAYFDCGGEDDAHLSVSFIN